MLEKATLVLFRTSSVVWLVSLVIHVVSAFGIDLLTPLPQIMFLQAFAFLLLISSIVYIKWRNTGIENKSAWLFNPVPSTFIFFAFAGLPYCFGNILGAGAYLQGVPEISDYDGYVLNIKGTRRIISEEKFHFLQAMTLRMFSSAGLAMSGIASFLFYPRKRAEPVV